MTNEFALVLVAAIGVLSTLASAFVGPFFSNKHERWRAGREDKQLLRIKAAEAFDELDRIMQESHAAGISSLQNLTTDNSETSPLPDLGRLRLLVSAYFPSAKAILSEYEKDDKELSKEIAAQLRLAAEEVNPDKVKVLGVLMVEKRNRKTYEFVRNIRVEISEGIPALK